MVKFSAMYKREKNGIFVCAKYVVFKINKILRNGGLGHFREINCEEYSK